MSMTHIEKVRYLKGLRGQELVLEFDTEYGVALYINDNGFYFDNMKVCLDEWHDWERLANEHKELFKKVEIR